MSYQLRTATAASSRLSHGSYTPSAESSSDENEQDDRASDWASSLGDASRTRSLFDDSVHPSPEEALAYDVETHGYDLRDEVRRLELDVYGAMRLVNLVRGEAMSTEQAKALRKDDKAFNDDALLVPVIPDDPLLQLDLALDESWSDDDLAAPNGPVATSSASDTSELDRARAEITRLRALLQSTITEDDESDGDRDDDKVDGVVGIAGPGFSSSGNGKGKGKGKLRDDDSHYFDSYAENDIHEIMLKDTIRTVSYGRYILSNPQIFSGAVVLDVGCGTGILSMFAAKSGAKKVYAVEASGLASKTRENVRRNGLDRIIEVIQSKVEDVDLPEKVDVIVSEWMGYMLLYESMLDSVLHARDRYLKPTGIMAPSQTRLVIAGITAQRILRERVDFWRNVYGFDMQPMDTPCYADGLVESVPPEEVVTMECILRDIDTHTATPKSLDFTTSFSLAPSDSSDGESSTTGTTVKAFLTWFDTFFSVSRTPVDQNEQVEIASIPEDAFSEAVAPVSVERAEAGTPRAVGFTTGPKGRETHWRQVAFLLREPITLVHGDRIDGRFYCRKSAHNSRELDVEVHYAVVKSIASGTGEINDATETTYIVQTYKVR